MRFRPTFCAHCGERIERSDWHFWTSRRFCEVCEAEYKGQDLIPQAFMVLCLIVGLFGIGTYMRSGPVAEQRVSREPQRFVERRPESELPPLRQPTPYYSSALPPAANQIQLQQQTYEQYPSPVVMPSQQSPPSAAPPPLIQRPVARVEQAVHYCGAETKKGTPCARRVKGPTRCYQHAGMPAMAISTEPAPAIKLKK